MDADRAAKIEAAASVVVEAGARWRGAVGQNWRFNAEYELRRSIDDLSASLAPAPAAREEPAARCPTCGSSRPEARHYNTVPRFDNRRTFSTEPFTEPGGYVESKPCPDAFHAPAPLENLGPPSQERRERGHRATTGADADALTSGSLGGSSTTAASAKVGEVAAIATRLMRAGGCYKWTWSEAMSEAEAVIDHVLAHLSRDGGG